VRLNLPDLTAHPLLTPKAKQMAMKSPTKFHEEAALAADLLGLTPELYDDTDDTDSLDRAIVLQVGFSLARDMSPLYASAEGGRRQGESTRYREQRELLVNPVGRDNRRGVLGDAGLSDAQRGLRRGCGEPSGTASGAAGRR
jgi:hypothetical protein